ncbi:Gti1/Pac2 family-domain-containing protein [Xylariales sp. PMI_506]|nr:Gti1/Pac2 family-domain-containing protein [Xylariales sp. PMI_506]
METYYGYVRTPADAIKLFEACRLGLLPRVQRRLSEKERQSIRSGSVFVWDEREAGMRRWTDGKSWSASRVSGSFLTYREMEGKRGSGFGNSRRSNGRTPDSGRFSDEDHDGEPEGYRYKADGLMKQSFSITTSQGQHLHLISYYSRPLPGAPDLPQPSSDPQLRHIVPAKGMYPESSLHESNPPALTRGPMQPYTTQPGPPEQPPYAYTWAPPPSSAWMGPWPPSPSGTPPWIQARVSPEVKPQPPIQLPPHHHLPVQLPPLPVTSASSQPALYPKAHLPYEHERLPPPSISRTYSHHSQQPPPTTASPRLQQLQQAAAHAVLIDPRLAATSARNPHGPLPPAVAPRLTPPRTNSASPPRTSGSDSTNPSSKASLSALLHPTPANSEPNSANPANGGSANSSPRAMATGPSHDIYHNEDVKAIRSLNRKFCI